MVVVVVVVVRDSATARWWVEVLYNAPGRVVIYFLHNNHILAEFGEHVRAGGGICPWFFWQAGEWSSSMGRREGGDDRLVIASGDGIVGLGVVVAPGRKVIVALGGAAVRLNLDPPHLERRERAGQRPPGNKGTVAQKH